MIPDKNKIPVVILCGGFGSRIRDVADNIPKPMIPIGKYPILWHIMKYYAHWDYKEFVLCLGYKSNVIKDFFLNYKAHTSDFTLDLGGSKPLKYHNQNSELDWQVTFAETGLESLTGARVKKIKKYVDGSDNFMLTYGDGVGDINIEELVSFHLNHKKILTVTGVKPPGRFGEIMSDSEGKIIEFNEKPQSTTGKISGGFFVCRKEIFDYLDDRENLTFEQEPMRNLAKEGEMMLYEHKGFWQCMDTNRDYLLLKGLCEKGEAPWIKW